MEKSKSILVISNGDPEFETAVSLLRKKGYRVMFENDLNRALSMAKTVAPGLIISELAVANVDGLKLCCRARRDARLSAIPIVLVGELSKDSSIVADSMLCGAVEYYQKPLDQVMLDGLCRRMDDVEDLKPVEDLIENILGSIFENISDVISRFDTDLVFSFERSSRNPTRGYSAAESSYTRNFDPIGPIDSEWISEINSFESKILGAIESIERLVRLNNGSLMQFDSEAKRRCNREFARATLRTLLAIRTSSASDHRRSNGFDLMDEAKHSNSPILEAVL